MKISNYKSEKMEDVCAPIAAAAAAEPQPLGFKFSPVKLEPCDFKPPCPLTAERWATPPLAGAESSQDKENSTSTFHNRTLEDSGYLTLHNSHIEDGHCGVAQQGRTSSQQSSPSKCQRRASPLHLAASPLEGRPGGASSTSVRTTLPLLRFHEAVCEELAKDFRKNKR